ncbi:MAG: ribosome biogenesis/translation initiation ATPase RLI [Thaumarchaeota archaeon]|jgi:ATP-binding cassette subfamily E protein 1|nr:ribosome biogenesis/translation initiation ATPase RLI [Nitrososphaerota archaeon]
MKGLKVAIIDREICRFDKCSHECQRFCPPQISGEKVVEFGEDGYPTINETLCIGCGICEKKCPFSAIRIVNLPSELGRDRVHQYGVNAFRLYRLPLLKKGYVVGLVGMNGIGKSTALKILSGTMQPNLGSESSITWDDVIKRYKGTTYAAYFKALIAGELKVSVKPQAVYEIPRAYSGTVQGLIDSLGAGENGRIIEELGIKDLLNKNLSELSGGELQSIAISASLSKKADFYFLDEPSSYLDVYNRHRVARVVRELVEEGAGVLLVEHDLTFLDYASDYVHILYGEPAVYGIVSNPMTNSEGVNSLIAGEIREENVRIRNYLIKFREPSIQAETTGQVMFSIPKFARTYPGFRLDVDGKDVREGEIIGVLGPNGIGKTTFLRIIAGMDRDDSGTVQLGIKIAYKPQYLEVKEDKTVEQALSGLEWNSYENMNLLMTPLRVDRLMNKNLSELSGGELQKVAIAVTLLQDAMLYALDEPSAFTDVEDRIALAKILSNYMKRRGRSGIVIDHDLMIIDLISDSIIVFSGTPNIHGTAIGPLPKRDAMNMFLRGMDITYRRDEVTSRPRVNKPGSRLDREQKSTGEYYYSR